MNIVIVDDDNSKVERIKRVFDSVNPKPLAIDIGGSVAEAMILLKSKKYDLLLLDLNLPIRNNETPRKDGGVKVLKELNRNQSLQKPSSVIGLTGHNDLVNENKKYFEIEGWTLFEINNTNFDWEEAILNKINHIYSTKLAKRGTARNNAGSKPSKDGKNMSLVMFWSIICPVTTAAFLLGFYFGQARFDKEKADLYEENKTLRKELQGQDGTLKESQKTGSPE
jgi:CheY-like chemotaxis protein